MNRAAPRPRFGQSIMLFFKLFKAGLLGVLAISGKEGGAISSWWWFPWLDLILRTWQMISFVTDSSLGQPWPADIAPIEVGGSFTNLRAYTAMFPNTLFSESAYYIALSWVVTLIALLGWGIWNFARDTMPFVWPLRVLRIMANLSVGPLFIPLLQLLLAPVACTSACDTMPSTVKGAVGIVLALSITSLAFLFAAVFYDSGSLTRSPDASAHGRVAVVNLLIKLVATVVGGRVVSGLSVAFIASTLLVCGLSWLLSYLIFLPCYQHTMNASNVGAAFIFLWSLLCLVLNNTYRATDAGLTLWLGAPAVFCSGVLLTTSRAASIAARPVALLASPYEVELQNRYLLHHALWGHFFYRQPESPGTDNAGLAALLAQDASSSADVLARAATLRDAVPAATISRVLSTYRAAAGRFPDSAIIHVFIARFYAEWLGDRHMMLSHLSQAERRSPAIDLSFIIFATRRSDEADSGGSGGGSTAASLTAINRVAFEKHAADARLHVSLASSKNLGFWSELVEAQPDLTKLHRLSSEMNASCVAAEAAFSAALELVAQSVAVLRLYAAFNLHVLVNTDKAEVLLAEADRIEEASSKEHRAEGTGLMNFGEETNVELWTESTSYLTVSASTRDVGTIVSVNSAACKLFGLSRLQLERRSVFSLLPPPLAAFYEESLRSHAVSGEGAIVNFTRLSFIQTRSGTVTPVVASFKDAPADDGPPAYLFIVRELQSSLNCILLDGNDVIYGVTSGSLSLLEIATSTLRSHEARMQDYVSEWALPGVRDELLSPAGRVLRVDVEFVVGAAVNDDDGGDDGDGDADSAAAVSDVEDEGGARGVASPAVWALRSPTSRAGAAVESSGVRSTWIRAHLQPMRLLGEGRAFVLHWTRLPSSDTTLINKAELKRAELLGIMPSLKSPATTAPPPPELAPRTSLASALTVGRAASRRIDVESQPTPPPPPLAFSPPHADADDDGVLATLFGASKSAGDDAGHAATDAEMPAARPTVSAALSPAPRSVAASVALSAGGKSQRSGTKSARSLPVGAFRDDAKSSSDGRSRDDRSSATSDSHNRVARTMTRLRRVLATDATTLMPGLWWLRQAGRALVVLAIVLTVALVIVTRSSFQSAYNNTIYVQTASDALYYKGAAIIAAQNLILNGRGWLPLSAAGVAKNRAAIVTNVNNFLSAETTLFSLAQSSGNSAAFTTRYLSLVRFDLPGGSLTGNVVVVNAREVAADFAATLLAIANLPASDFTLFADGSARGHHLIASLNTNYMRGGNGHEGLLYTGNLGYISTLSTQDSIRATQNFVFGMMTGVLGLLGLFVFLPILRHVDRTGDEIMTQFVTLPLPVRRGLFAQSQRRMLMLRRFTRDDDDVDDGRGDDLEELNAGDVAVAVTADAAKPDGAVHVATLAAGETAALAVLGAPKPASDKDALPAVDENGMVNWDLVLNTAFKASSEKASGKKRAKTAVFRKSRASFGLLALRFLTPLIILEVLFLSVYLTFATTASNALALTSVSAAANTRASCGRQALADLIKLMTLQTDVTYVELSYLSTFQSASCVLDHTALLAYGTIPPSLVEPYASRTPTVENGASSVLSAADTATVYDAMFGDACPFLASVATSTFDVSHCHSFSSGVVRLGLAAVSNAWASKFALLADNKLRTVYTAGDGMVNGTGFTTPSALFNYTSVKCARAGGSLALGCPEPNSVSRVPTDGSFIPPPLTADVNFAGADNVTSPGVIPATAVVSSIAASFASAEFAWLTEDLQYLTPGLRAVAAIYDTAAESVVLGYIDFLTTFSAIWITFFALVIFLGFIPSVDKKNSDIHTTRSLLLYLPVPVVTRAPSILALVDDILARNSDQLTTIGGGVMSNRQVAPA